MNRGVDRGDIFFDDADRLEFGRLLGLIHERFGVEIHAYCLMSNHYHLLIRCPDGGLSDAMHLFASLFVRFVNDRIDRDGPLFKSRFHARPISTVSHLANSLRYIHLNPMDIPGVDDPAAYRWSSHRAYLGRRRAPVWLDLNFFLGCFGGDPTTLNAFVTGIDRSETSIDCTVNELTTAAEFVVAEQSNRRLRSRHAEARALAITLADGGSKVLRSEFYAQLGLSAGALRTAQARSRQLFEVRSELAQMRQSAEILLAAA
jgi:putative transposase